MKTVVGELQEILMDVWDERVSNRKIAKSIGDLIDRLQAESREEQQAAQFKELNKR